MTLQMILVIAPKSTTKIIQCNYKIANKQKNLKTKLFVGNSLNRVNK